MSEELHTYIEPELEARITAFVLGEASEFEVDELERLIAEKPELAVFQRRVKMMHGLLGDVMKQESDEEWQLSDNKRAELRRVFLQNTVKRKTQKSSSTSIAQKRAAISIAACLLVCLVLFVLMQPIYKRGSIERHEPEIVSYSVAADESEESVPKLDETPVSGKLFRNDKPSAKPSIPNASMPRVIASNSVSDIPVPVPDIDVDGISLDFGGVDEFGDGWGSGTGWAFGDVMNGKTESRFAFSSEKDASAVGGLKRDLTVPKLELGVQGGFGTTIAGKKIVQMNEGRQRENIASKEDARRAQLVSEADKALLLGREAYANKNYEEAYKQYQQAVNLLPPGPASEERVYSYTGHLDDASVALSQRYRRIGKYNEARNLLKSTLARDPSNLPAKKQLEYLEDPIRTSPALTYEHMENVDRVRKGLYAGEGYFNLGKYDEAEVEAKKVLRIDPYNTAARRQLEKIAASRSDYYKAAYDHTRAEQLMEVDQAWELAVPPEGLAEAAVEKTTEEDGQVAQISEELQKKSNDLADRRRELMDIAEKVGVVWVEDERGGRILDQIELRNIAERSLYDVERDREKLKFQINKLLKLEDEELISAAAELPDIGFKEVHNQYSEAKREIQKMEALGLGAEDPSLIAKKKHVSDLQASLKKRSVDVRESLKHKLTLVEGNVEKMKEVLNAQQDDGTQRARSFQAFKEARKAYQKAQKAKDKLEAQLKAQSSAPKKPQKRAVTEELPDEIVTSQTPFSTFSLNVSDVSFKLAKVALLENGQQPDAAKVRTEEFVNAFDYGDPSPRRGEPVACAIEQSAHPFLLQRNLVRIGMKTASVGRSTPLRLTVLLDNSGSMEREDREASVLAAMQVLAKQLGPQDVITLVGFASKPRLLADRVSGDKADQLVSIVANTPSEGGTNLEEALRLARTLAMRQKSEGAQDRVVLITDGVTNLGNTVPEDLSQEIETMRQLGIAFDACGVGAEGLNDEILEALTRKGDGRYYFLNRAEDADSGFAKQLAGALSPAAQNVKVQVKFNPNRVTKYRLLGFEKHRLNKQDFRNDKVDAAEMAAEEAGNAVYQMQVNPEGFGELGEVFVRFRDMSTGRMVERSWPLPYEPEAKAFDLAAPSMQLAGTAALLGEKLHGTDAGSAQFSTLRETLGKLRTHYHADKRVQDLIRMCEKVK